MLQKKAFKNFNRNNKYLFFKKIIFMVFCLTIVLHESESKIIFMLRMHALEFGFRFYGSARILFLYYFLFYNKI